LQSRIANSDEDTLDLADRLKYVQTQLEEARSPQYKESLVGTIGVDPMQPSLTDDAMINRMAGVS
jgi:hypothetical protein